MTPEGKVKAKVKKWLKDHGIWYISVIPSPLGGSTGTPDLLCCIRGRFVGLEIKAPGNGPTPLQLHQIKAIKAAGGIAVVVDDAEQLPPLLMPLLKGDPNASECAVSKDSPVAT
jgi:hypothetical protein